MAFSYLSTAQSQVLPNGTYAVTNRASNLYWDDPNSSKQPLTNIILWTDNGGSTNQQWTFTKQDDGYYQILNKASGLALNNPASSTTAGTALIQYPWQPVTPNGAWSVRPASRGGGWIVTNRASGLVAGPSNNTKNTKIDQEVASGATAQVWTIGNCAAGTITPYISTPEHGWQNATAVTTGSTSHVNLGPQAAAGTWSWSGTNGFTANTREIDNVPLTAGATNNFAVTYTSPSGCVSTETFAIAVGTKPSLVIHSIGNQTFPEAPFTLSASSNSPAPITYSVVSGPATISADQLTLVSGGTVVVQAAQAGAGGYGSATSTTSFAVSTPMSRTLTYSLTGSSTSIGPSSDSPNFNFIDSNGQFFLQNAFSQYDTVPGEHIWNFYTGKNELDSGLKLSPANSVYDTQSLCMSKSPVYTDFYANSGYSAPTSGAYADGNFCDVIGVWVDPDSGDWYGIVHNEIYPKGPRMDALSYAVSTDHGASWSQKTPILTSAYGVGDYHMPYHDYGDGDPRFLVDTASGYFYIISSTRIQDSNDYTRVWWTRVARAPISKKFDPVSWQKYYDGGWGTTAGVLWTCNAYLNTSCPPGNAAAGRESNIGPDLDPSKTQQVAWPVSARSTKDLDTFKGSLWGASNLSWSVYLQKYVVTSISPTTMDFYTTADIASQAWTYAGSVPYTNNGSWYIWSLDGGNLSSTQTTGNSFYVFCAINCSKYGSEYTPISVSFHAGSALPIYYTGYNGVASASHTYLITHPYTAAASATTSNKWTFVPVGDGFFYLKQGSRYLQVADGDSGRAWGAAVSLAAPEASNAPSPDRSRQQWRFEKITALNGVAPAVPQYRLINRYSGLALSFTSTALDSSYFGWALTAPPRDWDPVAGSTYSAWHAADQELVFVAQ